MIVKGSSDQSRIRHRTTLKLNFWIDSKSTEDHILIQSRSMSDPTFSDIDTENEMALVWTILKFIYSQP